MLLTSLSASVHSGDTKAIIDLLDELIPGLLSAKPLSRYYICHLSPSAGWLTPPRLSSDISNQPQIFTKMPIVSLSDLESILR